MTKKLVTSVLLLLLLTSFVQGPKAKAETGPVNIPCNSYILIDLDNGRVLAEKNADMKIFPASTTKIMTGILGLERSPLDKVMTASYAAVRDIGAGGMHIGIMEGEKMPFSDLIKACLLHSANESANIIAENSASSRQEFIKLMNKKAKEIGAIHTQYRNVHGMPDTEHYTTARDLAIISRYAMLLSPASEQFREIVNQSNYTLSPTNKHSTWEGLKCTNKLWNYPSECYNKVIGIKTGYINASGHNFVSAVESPDGKRLLSVVSGIRTFGTYDNIFYYTRKLLEYGYKTNATARFKAKNTVLGDVKVVNQPGGTNSVDVVIDQNLKGWLPINKKDWSIEERIAWDDKVYQAPLSSGTKVGSVSYFLDDSLIGTADIITQTDVPLSFQYIRSQIIKSYVIIVIILLTLIYFISSITRTKKRRSVRNVNQTIQSHW